MTYPDPPEFGNEDAALDDLRERAGTGGIGICVTEAEIIPATTTPAGNHVARALRRYYPRAWFITATESRIEITGSDGTRGLHTPAGASLSLAAALAGHEVAPFSFTLPASPDDFSPRRSRPEAATRKAA